MALRLLYSSARRSGGTLRALCAPLAQTTCEFSPSVSLQETQNALRSSRSGSGALFGENSWGSMHGKKTVAQKLSETLEAELEHEEESYCEEEVLRKGPPSGFEIKEEVKEEARIVLHKKHGEEDITIEAIFTQQPIPEPDNPDDEESSVSHKSVFSGKIAKGDDILHCEFESDGGYVDVLHAGLEKKGKDPHITAYTGPEFPELDEKLQDNFTTWLEERGIGPELGDYLIQLVHDRELKAYKDWLKSVNAFILK
ncbi:hypothetical protein BSKO_04434 [Bryopsis sp. KO-2023]|nr:hypothetical protein BSKO_04434 [Bryopsis sp. KO-2023]